MAIQVSDNFSYLARKPLDGRQLYNTIAEMAAMADATLYDGIIAYNKEDEQFYTWKESNVVDATLGKWILFETGGGSGVSTNAEYKQGAAYSKGSLVVYDGKLYLVNKDFTSDVTEPVVADSLELDLQNKNLLPVDTDKDTDTNCHVYIQDTEYTPSDLILHDGKLYYVSATFTSDNTETDVEDSFLLDVLAGNLVLVNPDIPDAQPPAPAKYTITIEDGGTGYSVGEILASTEPGVYLEVLTTDISTGEILSVKVAEDATAQDANGTGADIQLEAILQVGWNGDWVDFPQDSNDAVLGKDVTANVTVGGIKDKQVVSIGTTFTEFVEKLLHKEIIPTCNFSATNTGVHEIGTTVNGCTMTLQITNLASVTTPINRIEFKIAGAVVDTQPFVDGQSNYVYTSTDPITTTTQVSATLVYDGTLEITSKGDYTFVNASYYGAVNTTTPDEATVLGLTKAIKVGKAYKWTNANLDDERFCYAYPASMGNLTTIKDANNFEYLASYTRNTLAVDGVAYNVYVLTDPVTITGAMQNYA